MKDLYSAQNYQKFLQKQKKKEKRSALDEEVESKAKEKEAQNYEMAHEARKKLETGYETQKRTTKKLLSQGEQLDQADKDVDVIDENIEEGKHLTGKIKEEGKLFSFRMPFVSGIKKLFKPSKKKEPAVQEKAKPPVAVHRKREEAKVSPEKKLIPGQEKTDRELEKIYSALGNVKGEAKYQYGELKRQDETVKKIGARTKKSEKDMENMTDELKKL